MNASDIITAIESAKELERQASRNLLAACKAYSTHIKGKILRYHLDRGTLCRRTGWPNHKIGNFLHNDYKLKHDEMITLANAMSPLTPEEKKIAKRQPKRTKALLS